MDLRPPYSVEIPLWHHLLSRLLANSPIICVRLRQTVNHVRESAQRPRRIRELAQALLTRDLMQIVGRDHRANRLPNRAADGPETISPMNLKLRHNSVPFNFSE